MILKFLLSFFIIAAISGFLANKSKTLGTEEATLVDTIVTLAFAISAAAVVICVIISIFLYLPVPGAE